MPGELVFGFDPSLTHFGYAVARHAGPGRVNWLATGVWISQPWSGSPTKTDDTRRRCEGLAALAWKLVRDYDAPSIIAVEALALPLGRTSMVTVSALGRVRGIVDALCAAYQLRAREFQPQALKKAATGDRLAEKAAVQLALERTYPDLANLFSQIGKSNREHAADACAAIHAALTAAPHQEEA